MCQTILSGYFRQIGGIPGRWLRNPAMPGSCSLKHPWPSLGRCPWNYGQTGYREPTVTSGQRPAGPPGEAELERTPGTSPARLECQTGRGLQLRNGKGTRGHRTASSRRVAHHPKAAGFAVAWSGPSKTESPRSRVTCPCRAGASFSQRLHFVRCEQAPGLRRCFPGSRGARPREARRGNGRPLLAVTPGHPPAKLLLPVPPASRAAGLEVFHQETHLWRWPG